VAERRSMSDRSPTVELPLIDPQDALRRAGGRPELAHELFRMLCDSLEDSAMRLRQALDAGDRAGLHETAHRLHGACLYCGVPRLREAALQLERMTGTGHDAGSSGACVEGVARLLEAIEDTSRVRDPVGARADV